MKKFLALYRSYTNLMPDQLVRTTDMHLINDWTTEKELLSQLHTECKAEELQYIHIYDRVGRLLRNISCKYQRKPEVYKVNPNTPPKIQMEDMFFVLNGGETGYEAGEICEYIGASSGWKYKQGTRLRILQRMPLTEVVYRLKGVPLGVIYYCETVDGPINAINRIYAVELQKAGKTNE